MSRRLFIGKPKREGRFQDFPLVNLGDMSISNWVETLPIVDDDRRENTYTDKISDRKAEIAKRRAEIISKLARLDCIKNALSKINSDETLSIKTNESVVDHDKLEVFNQIVEIPIEAPAVDLFETEVNLVGSEVALSKESIWSRVKKRTSDLYYKAGMYVGRVMLAAGDLSAGKMMAKPEMKLGENLAEYERRVQRIGMTKVVGLTVLSSVAVHGFKDVLDAISSNTVASYSGHVDHSLIDDTLSNQHVVVNTETIPVFSFDAYNVTSGEGLFDTMNQMGITDVGRQYEILQKVGPELQNMNLVYPIDGGSWGISSPGQLPKDALDLIWNCSKNI